MTVKQIVKQYLEQHGYDGLYCDDCACKLDDLVPCDYVGVEECEAGYFRKPTLEDDEADFFIGPEKEKL